MYTAITGSPSLCPFRSRAWGFYPFLKHSQKTILHTHLCNLMRLLASTNKADSNPSTELSSEGLGVLLRGTADRERVWTYNLVTSVLIVSYTKGWGPAYPTTDYFQTFLFFLYYPMAPLKEPWRTPSGWSEPLVHTNNPVSGWDSGSPASLEGRQRPVDFLRLKAYTSLIASDGHGRNRARHKAKQQTDIKSTRGVQWTAQIEDKLGELFGMMPAFVMRFFFVCFPPSLSSDHFIQSFTLHLNRLERMLSFVSHENRVAFFHYAFPNDTTALPSSQYFSITEAENRCSSCKSLDCEEELIHEDLEMYAGDAM